MFVYPGGKVKEHARKAVRKSGAKGKGRPRESPF
jgi:hypothetical protein